MDDSAKRRKEGVTDSTRYRVPYKDRLQGGARRKLTYKQYIR